MKANEVKILSMEIFEPIKVVTTDLNTIIFLPTEMVLQIQSMKGKSKGYLLAIKEIGKDTWQYLDASAIKNRRDMEFYFPLYPKDEMVPEIVHTFE